MAARVGRRGRAIGTRPGATVGEAWGGAMRRVAGVRFSAAIGGRRSSKSKRPTEHLMVKAALNCSGLRRLDRPFAAADDGSNKRLNGRIRVGRLDGRSTVVTGAASGIGRAT